MKWNLIADHYTRLPPRCGAASAPGENTIKVKVTAEDPSATRTYTVVVTREAPPWDGVWCSALTVRSLSGGHLGCANSQTEKCSNASTLFDDAFTHDMTNYAVTSVQLRSTGQLQLSVSRRRRSPAPSSGRPP